MHCNTVETFKIVDNICSYCNKFDFRKGLYEWNMANFLYLLFFVKLTLAKVHLLSSDVDEILTMYLFYCKRCHSWFLKFGSVSIESVLYRICLFLLIIQIHAYYAKKKYIQWLNFTYSISNHQYIDLPNCLENKFAFKKAHQMNWEIWKSRPVTVSFIS